MGVSFVLLAGVLFAVGWAAVSGVGRGGGLGGELAEEAWFGREVGEVERSLAGEMLGLEDARRGLESDLEGGWIAAGEVAEIEELLSEVRVDGVWRRYADVGGCSGGRSVILHDELIRVRGEVAASRERLEKARGKAVGEEES